MTIDNWITIVIAALTIIVIPLGVFQIRSLIRLNRVELKNEELEGRLDRNHSEASKTLATILEKVNKIEVNVAGILGYEKGRRDAEEEAAK